MIRQHVLGGMALLLMSGTAIGGGKEAGTAPLVRPESAPDDDAKGRVDLSQKGSNHTSFRIAAHNVEGVALEAFLEDGVGATTFTSVGTLGADDDPGSASLQFSGKGGGLPLGVTGLDELIGRRIELRAAATVYLQGLIPGSAIGSVLPPDALMMHSFVSSRIRS